MTDTKQWSEAPAGTYNPFACDERCYSVHYITGDAAIDVIEEIAELRAIDQTIIDYDVFFDGFNEKWVGVTCRDHDPV